MSQFRMDNSAYQGAFEGGAGGFASNVLGFANRWGAGITAGQQAGKNTLGLIEDTFKAQAGAEYQQCIMNGGNEAECKARFDAAVGRTQPQGQAPQNMSMNPSAPQPYRINWGS